jgi:hypothetical protein
MRVRIIQLSTVELISLNREEADISPHIFSRESINDDLPIRKVLFEWKAYFATRGLVPGVARNVQANGLQLPSI